MTNLVNAINADWSTVCTNEKIPNDRRVMTIELILSEYNRLYSGNTLEDRVRKELS